RLQSQRRGGGPQRLSEVGGQALAHVALGETTASRLVAHRLDEALGRGQPEVGLEENLLQLLERRRRELLALPDPIHAVLHGAAPRRGGAGAAGGRPVPAEKIFTAPSPSGARSLPRSLPDCQSAAGGRRPGPW